MDTVTARMSAHHKSCDDLFGEAEEAAAKADWERAVPRMRAFVAEMERHFAMEENILFPELEAAMGGPQGPTRIMRTEHARMRGLLEILTQAVEVKDAQACLGTAETLLILIQQHNLKEEQILYPMSDEALAPKVEALLHAMHGADAGR